MATLNQQFYSELAGRTGHFAHAWNTRTNDDAAYGLTGSDIVLVASALFGEGGLNSAVARAQFCGPDATWQPPRLYQWLKTQLAPDWSSRVRVIDVTRLYGGSAW